MAVLVQDGTLELNREVTHSWPEVAAEGEGDAVPSSWRRGPGARRASGVVRR
ncbi:hypothetical protein GCM10027073_66890 [Streptomyces chlorus]